MGAREFYLEAVKRLLHEDGLVTETVLEGEQAGKKRFLSKEEEAEEPYAGVCRERLYGKPSAVLCGGGHVSCVLAEILGLLDFQVQVIDDRAEFAAAERFPGAKVYCEKFASCLEREEFGRNAYYVIITRGHKDDYTCLTRILKKPSAYVGMIGSKKKVALSFQRLRADGFLEEEIQKIHAPIGLDIGAKTPAEIAVSIAGEMIREKNRQERSILEEQVVQGIRDPASQVLVSVIEKTGSSPRGKGTRMAVYKDGSIAGTVGGGSVEFAAIQRALHLTGDFALEEYDLGNAQASSLGMVCGGRVRLMFERL